jgi:hypothetical protein
MWYGLVAEGQNPDYKATLTVVFFWQNQIINVHVYLYSGLGVRIMGFDVTFNNISVISRWLVVLVEETGYDIPAASHSQTLSIFRSYILVCNI